MHCKKILVAKSAKMLYNNDTDSDDMLQEKIMNNKKKIKSTKDMKRASFKDSG